MRPEPFAGLDPDVLPGFIPSVHDAMQVVAATFHAVEEQYACHKCEPVELDGGKGARMLGGAVAAKYGETKPGDVPGTYFLENHLFVGHAAMGILFTTRLMGTVRERLQAYFDSSLPAGALRDVGDTTFRVVLPDGEFTLLSKTAAGRSYISTTAKVKKRRFAFN